MDRPPPPSPPHSGPGYEHGSDEDRCRLLGTTGLVVQALMGVFVILSLVVKRQLERRKRSWRIWMYDVSKQLAGQAVVHGLNILISDLVASAAHNNPCSLYFLNVLIDTTIGVGIIYFSLKAYTWYFSKYMGLEGFVSGQYGHPPRPDYWWKQLAPYLLSIITMKLLVLLPLTLPGISKFLIDASHSMLDYLSPQVQIIFVMAIFPVIMNVFQFCLVDQLIKGGKDFDADQDDMDASDRGRGRGRGGDGRGYSRVPGWEGEHDGDGDGDGDSDADVDIHGERDIESGRRRQGPRKVNKDKETQTRNQTKAPRETSQSRDGNGNGITTRSSSMAAPVIPSSPLLSPGDVRDFDYGSTTPSPIGSPDKPLPSFLGVGVGNGDGFSTSRAGQGKQENIWTKIMSKLSDTSMSTSASSPSPSPSNSNYASAPTSRVHSVVFDSSTTEDLRSSSSGTTGQSGEDRLQVRIDGRGQRSAAPSPDSIRPVSASGSLQPSPISSSSHQNYRESEVGHRQGRERGQDALGTTEGLSRHLPEGLEREARWTLSPPESPTVSDGRDTVDSVSLREVHGHGQTQAQMQAQTQTQRRPHHRI
ncbi:hypothetical protein IAU59_004243 [Kwoniella sp. CBS 9459]